MQRKAHIQHLLPGFADEHVGQSVQAEMGTHQRPGTQAFLGQHRISLWVWINCGFDKEDKVPAAGHSLAQGKADLGQAAEASSLTGDEKQDDVVSGQVLGLEQRHISNLG